ncbi:hypothetical protein CLF_113206, partial [Clonorchis sinensis]
WALMLGTGPTVLGKYFSSLLRSLLSYKLYKFLRTDGMGIGRPVVHAFFESAYFAPLRKLLCSFRDMMGGQYSVKTFVMDGICQSCTIRQIASRPQLSLVKGLHKRLERLVGNLKLLRPRKIARCMKHLAVQTRLSLRQRTTTALDTWFVQLSATINARVFLAYFISLIQQAMNLMIVHIGGSEEAESMYRPTFRKLFRQMRNFHNECKQQNGNQAL